MTLGELKLSKSGRIPACPRVGRGVTPQVTHKGERTRRLRSKGHGANQWPDKSARLLQATSGCFTGYFTAFFTGYFTGNFRLRARC